MAVALMAVVLAACTHGDTTRPLPSSEPQAPLAMPTTPVSGGTLGTGLLADNPNAIRVAFLAPLSGQAAPTGQALLNAAQIAAIEIGPQNFVLQPYDTGGGAIGAANAARTALSQGVKMIVGPLYSDSVRAVGPIATQAGIPVIAFSTDASVAGGNVNLIGFLPGEQARRMLDYALKNGKSSVAVLAPDTASGRAMADATRQAAATIGIRFVAAELYGQNGTGVDGAVARLQKAGRFDALLLADSGMGLATVASQLSAAGVSQGSVMILGTMLWASEQNLGRNGVLVGARYPAPDEAALAGFRTQYQKMYGSVPPDIAALGHDATALAAVLARTGPQAFTNDMVRNPQGFVGVGGLFRFRPDGTVERGLSIREVTSTGSTQIEAAPRSFTGPTM